MDRTPPATAPVRRRRRKPPEQRLSDKVEARITPGERRRLDEILARDGVTESQFVRRMLALTEAAAA